MTTMEQANKAVIKTQNDVFAASRRMAVDITDQVTKIVRPLSGPIVNVVGDVFDFAGKILSSEQHLVTDVIHDIETTGSTQKTRTAKKTPARHAAAAKTTTRRPPAAKASA